MPNVYIIAGPNGAGKTTFARAFLPAYADCKNFVNADLIAQGVSPFLPEDAAFRAGRLMLREIGAYASRGADFGFETTLSGRSYLRLIAELKSKSYRVHFFFLSLPKVHLALSRIRTRVSQGGHNIPVPVVRRRFQRSICNFLLAYRGVADSWMLFDNAGAEPRMVAFEKEGLIEVTDKGYYESLTRNCRDYAQKHS